MTENETTPTEPKPPRKKRSASKFILLEDKGSMTIASADQQSVNMLAVAGQAATIKACRMLATQDQMPCANYLIVSVRDRFMVSEKQLKLIER